MHQPSVPHPEELSKNHVSRRCMLSTSLAATAAIATAPVEAAPAKKTEGYIDAHVHVWTPDTKAYPLSDRYDQSAMQPPSFTPQQLMAHAEPCGVSRVVLIQMSFYGFDNSYMLDVMKQFPGQYSGVAVIDPDASPTKTMRELKKQGVRGFRIVAGQKDPNTWLQNKSMKAMWACAADEGLAMCPLMNPQYIPSVHKMCQQYPKTRCVVDHFARIGIDGSVNKSDVDNLCRLADHNHTYVKTSAFYALGKKQAPYTDLGGMIHRCMHAYGSERLMWATDCPYQVGGGHTYQDSVDLIRHKLEFISNRDRQWLLEKTAEKVFFS